MLYAIISQDVEQSLALRRRIRPAHLDKLEELKQQGRLVLAGPHPSIDNDDPGDAGFSGSLIVAEFASLEHAQQWADSDPYATAGVFASSVVKPFRQVFP